MQRGEIWRVSLDPAAGHEQQGTRPVLIVSPRPFNELTRTPIVVPITTGAGSHVAVGSQYHLNGPEPLPPA